MTSPVSFKYKMKIILIIFLSGLTAIADPELTIGIKGDEITVNVSEYPKGKALALLGSNNMKDWYLCTDEEGEFLLHFIPANTERNSVKWVLLKRNSESFFKVVVLNYDIK